MRENWRPKEHFPVKKNPVSVTKRLLFTSKLAKKVKEFHFKLFLALALASGATRPRLGVSEHPSDPQFQRLKIDLCGYHRPNYFSRPAPDLSLLRRYMWKENLFNIRLLALYIIPLLLTLYTMNNSFAGNNKLFQ